MTTFGAGSNACGWFSRRIEWNFTVDNGEASLYNEAVYSKKAVKRRVSRRSLSESPGWCDGAGPDLPNMVSEPGCR